MPSKYYLRQFHENSFYHIYNRGAYKQIIFKDDRDYQAFIEILAYYLTHPTGKPLSLTSRYSLKVRNLDKAIVPTYQLIAYCLMPNHFHLLLKQNALPTPDNSIASLLKRLSITYAMYFKNKYEHSGALFEGKYKNVTTKSAEHLLHLTRYIHLNPDHTDHQTYPYSSYQYYSSPGASPDWLHAHTVLDYFSSTNPSLTYQSFCREHITHATITPLLID